MSSKFFAIKLARLKIVNYNLSVGGPVNPIIA